MASAATGILPDIPQPTGVQILRLSRGGAPSFRVPSLPKLHGKGPLTTTKLCETIHKSTAGHVFDLSKHQEYSSFTKYNSLHDPHLKAYYYHPAMKTKLIKKRCVTTPGLRVICSLQEYNSYRNFLEMEFMKVHKRKEEEMDQMKTSCQEKHAALRGSVDQQRGKKRKQFFIQQERILRKKQLHFKKMKRKEEISKMKMLEERRMQRERNEMKREAEQERRKLEKMQKEHEEQTTRKRVHKQSVAMDEERMIHLQTMRHAEKMKGLEELDKRWQIHEEHAQKAKREQEERKQRQKEAREKRMRQREKIFQMLQEKEDERKKKMMEENHHEIELLKEEADKLEQKWQNRKISEVNEWKDKIGKQQECWQDLVKRSKDMRRKEHDKHIEDLLSNCSPPSCADPKRSHKISSSLSYVSYNSSKTTTHQPTVRFNPTPIVHILDQPLPEEGENENEMATGDKDADCVEVIELEEDGMSLEDDDDEALEDAAEMEIAVLDSDLNEDDNESIFETDTDLKDHTTGEDQGCDQEENGADKLHQDEAHTPEEDQGCDQEENGADKDEDHTTGEDQDCDEEENGTDKLHQDESLSSEELKLDLCGSSSLVPEIVTSASEADPMSNDDDAETRSIASSIVSSAIGKAVGKVSSTQNTTLE